MNRVVVLFLLLCGIFRPVLPLFAEDSTPTAGPKIELVEIGFGGN